jgi:hypothetical protein
MALLNAHLLMDLFPARRQEWLKHALKNARTIVLLLSSIAFCIPVPVCIAQEPPLEYQVKAAYLLNFTKFVQWPESAFSDQRSPLAICILGEDRFGTSLDEIVKGEVVNGHELVVQRIRRVTEARSCQVVYIGAPEKEAPKILDDLRPGILTVGEGEKFLEHGGIIAFVIENRRVRFDIDQRAAGRSMLTLSSRLMSVARSVKN